jgi:integrase/recombinase XerD
MDSWVQRGGPLAAFATDYREQLEHLGYTGHSVVTHLVLMGQLNRWMASSAVAVEGLDRARIEEFLETRRAGGQQRVPSSGVFDQLLVHLRAKEVLRQPVVEPKTSLDELLDRYERHLIEGRGVARSTAVAYVGVARRFLSERAIGDDETGLDGLRGEDVTTFLLRESARLSVLTAKNRVTGLRSLLRFLRLEGLVATDLAGSRPRTWCTGLTR